MKGTLITPVTAEQVKQYRRGLEDASNHAATLALEKVPMDKDSMQRLLGSPDFRTRIAEAIVATTRELGMRTASQERAAEIMGRNFRGLEEMSRLFKINPTQEEFAALAKVPFTEETLQACKDTHVLVAVLPLPILDIRGKVERKLFYSHEDAWYNKESFAREQGETGWHLVRKSPVPNSVSKTWAEQQSLLGNQEETPSAGVMTYTIIGQYLATGERLFERIYVRCSNVVSNGYRVYLGYFGGDGLVVNYYWGDIRDGILGLASARKRDLKD